MLVTIFTPTYNRGYILEKLHESLLAQTNTDFEWLVVDDGSTDNTEYIIADFIQQAKIDIKYIRTPNKGKQQAVNKGVEMAKGELFFIVDSDDYLTQDAVQQIVTEWPKIDLDITIAGLCLRKINYNTGQIIGGYCDVKQGDFTSIEIAYKLGVWGDKAEIFRTIVLREFPFPHFENENFIPEALVWNRIATKYKLRFINKGIYMCEYLEDGLSYNFMTNLRRNPNGFRLFYSELIRHKNIPLSAKIKAAVRWLQCSIYKQHKW